MALSIGSKVGLPINNKPTHAYFKLYVGQNAEAAIAVEWDTGKPQIYQAVEITKIGNAGTTVQMVLFDDNWTELETLFHSRRDISFEYGYVDGPRSKRYNMILTQYTVDIKYTGILLHIEAVSTSVYDNLNPKTTRSLGNNPSAAIRELCEEVLHYQIAVGDFKESQDVPENQLGEPQNFALVNDNPVSYILQEILPLARTAEGEPLTFYVDDTTEPPTAHLTLKHPEMSKVSKEYKTYIYARGYNSTVQSLSFQMKGVFGGMADVNGKGGLYFTTRSTTESINLSDKNQKEVASVSIGDEGLVEKKSEGLSIDQSSVSSDLSHESKEVAEIKLRYSAVSQLDEAAIANLTILGDPDLELLDYVNIMIIQDDKKLYRLSGIYQIMGIVDTIENGHYLTTLKLIHAGWFSPMIEQAFLQRAANDNGVILDAHALEVTVDG